MSASGLGGVVLLHGFANNKRIMRRMASRLDAAGYATLNITYPSLSRSLIGIADSLVPRVSVFAESVSGPVHFVGHSLGGLVIRAHLTRHRPENLGRVVMLGTPNQGSELADWARRLRIDRLVLGRVGPYLVTQRSPNAMSQLGTVDFPLGVIAGNRPMHPRIFAPFFRSANDGKLTVKSTSVEGMRDNIALPLTHAALPHAEDAIGQTVHFLAHGKFDPEKLSN